MHGLCASITEGVNELVIKSTIGRMHTAEEEFHPRNVEALQFTVNLNWTVEFFPMPLFALHLYTPASFLVTLLIFILFPVAMTDSPWPSLVHVMLGGGFPEALQ